MPPKRDPPISAELKAASAQLRTQGTHFTAVAEQAQMLLQFAGDNPQSITKPTFQTALRDAVFKLDTQIEKVQDMHETYAELETDEEKTKENRDLYIEKSKLHTELTIGLREFIAQQQRAGGADAASTIANSPATNGELYDDDDNQHLNVLQHGTVLPKVQTALRPSRLQPDDGWVEFQYWKEKLLSYFQASNIFKFNLSVQHTLAYECMHYDLEKKCRMNVRKDWQVFGADGDDLTIVSELDSIFRQLNPLHARRQTYFDAQQRRGQSMSSFMAELDGMAGAAMLDDLDPEQLTIHRLISGCTDKYLRRKIMETDDEITFGQLKAIVNTYEAALASTNKEGRHDANMATGKHKYPRKGRGKSRQQQQQRGRSRSRNRSHSANFNSQNRCYRCGNSNHNADNCNKNKKDLKCQQCGKIGHVKSVCGLPNRGRSRARSQSPGRNRGRSPSPRGRGGRSQSNFSRANANQAETHSVVANATGAPTPRISLQLTAPGTGRVSTIRFMNHNCIPDSGASTTIIRKNLVKKNRIKFTKTKGETLKVANGRRIPVEGTVTMQAAYQGATTTITAIVCASLAPDILLGWEDCVSLGILPKSFPDRARHTSNHAEESGYDSDDSLNNFLIDPHGCALLKNKLLREYSDIIRDDLDGSTIKGATMHINLKNNETRPLHINVPKATPVHHKKAADALIQKLLKEGVIERVPANEPSEWCSMGFFVPKPNSEDVRLVTDFRRLNMEVKRAVKPFPSTRDIIRGVEAKSKFFCKMDAVQGYFQLPLAEESRPLTTFILESGRYRYLKGPMGLCATNDAFCEATDRAFEGQKGTQKIVDDGLTGGHDLPHLESRVRKILNKCRELNIVLSKKKFDISSSITFAGHIISHNGIRPDPAKVEAIKEFPEPTNLTEVRSFLGLANQLGYFIPDLTHVCRPIHELTKKDTAFLWSPAQDHAFQNAKEILTGDLLVHPFDSTLDTELYTDASRLGLGYLLLQKAKDGSNRLIRCGSRALTDAETRYAVTELECLAISYAVSHCDFYLNGAPKITVITDHRALVGIWQKPLAEVPNTRVLRYREKMLKYNLDIVWKAGKTHFMADALSRDPRFGHAQQQPSDTNEVLEDEKAAFAIIHEASLITPDAAIIADQKDDEYNALLDALDKKTLPSELSHYSKVFNELSVIGDGKNKLLIYDNSRLVIPQPARKQLLEKLHASHSGPVKTLALASRSLFWPTLKNDITQVCNSCQECKALAPAQQREPPNIAQMRPIAEMYPMSDTSSDLFEHEGKHYLVLVDRFSGYPFCSQLSKLNTEAVTDVLLSWFSLFGMPTRIRTDGGPQYRKIFDDFCSSNNIHHETTAAYCSSSNGLAERAVKTCKHLLIKCLEANENYEKALLAFRATPTGPDKPSPAQLFFHRDVKLPGIPKQEANLHFHSSDNMEGYIESRQQDADRVKATLEKRARKQPLPPLKPGDKVDIKNVGSRGWKLDSGTIMEEREDGRSFLLEDSTGRQTLRNRIMLRLSKAARAGLDKVSLSSPKRDSEEAKKKKRKRSDSEEEERREEEEIGTVKSCLKPPSAPPSAKRVRFLIQGKETLNSRQEEERRRKSRRLIDAISARTRSLLSLSPKNEDLNGNTTTSPPPGDFNSRTRRHTHYTPEINFCSFSPSPTAIGMSGGNRSQRRKERVKTVTFDVHPPLEYDVPEYDVPRRKTKKKKSKANNQQWTRPGANNPQTCRPRKPPPPPRPRPPPPKPRPRPRPRPQQHSKEQQRKDWASSSTTILNVACLVLLLSKPAEAIEFKSTDTWVICDGTSDPKYFVDEAKAGCYQALSHWGRGNPCASYSSALSIANDELRQLRADLKAAQDDRDQLRLTVTSTDSSAKFKQLRDELRRVVEQEQQHRTHERATDLAVHTALSSIGYRIDPDAAASAAAAAVHAAAAGDPAAAAAAAAAATRHYNAGTALLPSSGPGGGDHRLPGGPAGHRGAGAANPANHNHGNGNNGNGNIAHNNNPNYNNGGNLNQRQAHHPQAGWPQLPPPGPRDGGHNEAFSTDPNTDTPDADKHRRTLDKAVAAAAALSLVGTFVVAIVAALAKRAAKASARHVADRAVHRLQGRAVHSAPNNVGTGDIEYQHPPARAGSLLNANLSNLPWSQIRVGGRGATRDGNAGRGRRGSFTSSGGREHQQPCPQAQPPLSHAPPPQRRHLLRRVQHRGQKFPFKSRQRMKETLSEGNECRKEKLYVSYYRKATLYIVSYTEKQEERQRRKSKQSLKLPVQNPSRNPIVTIPSNTSRV